MIWILWLACANLEPMHGETFSFESSGDGVVEIDITIENETAFLLSVFGDSKVVVDKLISPDGDILIEGDDWMQDIMYTGAVWPGIDLNLNWPIRDVDPALESGTYTIEVMALDNAGYLLEDIPLEGIWQGKRDLDPSFGRFKTRILIPESTPEEIQNSITEAALRWAEIWNNIGIELLIEWGVATLPQSLTFPTLEEDLYLNLSREADGDQMVMIVSESIENGMDYLGFSGGIPGALSPSPSAAVLLSWLGHSGINGEFDAEEIRIFGETMAHEASHYLGLFHPQDEDGSVDALSDTLNCETVSDCEEEEGDLLMFPYPVCNVSGCIPQGRLSPEQSAVLHRYVGVKNE